VSSTNAQSGRQGLIRLIHIMAAVVAVAGCEARRETPPSSSSAANETPSTAAPTVRGPVPKEIADACDSAASLANQKQGVVVRVVRDTTFRYPGSENVAGDRGCAVMIRSYPNSAGTSNKLFWNGLPGGSWTLNEFDAVDSDSMYGVFRGKVMCEIQVRPPTDAGEQHTIGFDINCSFV